MFYGINLWAMFRVCQAVTVQGWDSVKTIRFRSVCRECRESGRICVRFNKGGVAELHTHRQEQQERQTAGWMNLSHSEGCLEVWVCLFVLF